MQGSEKQTAPKVWQDQERRLQSPTADQGSQNVNPSGRDEMTYSNLPPPEGEGKLEPVVFERDGKALANSRDVAACFEKRHADVLRALESLGCSAEFTERNFAFSTYTDGTGRSLPCCDMTKDGFAFLVMGFTGGKAAAFKERYIDRFNAMESALKNRASGFAIPQTLPEALRLAADQADTIEQQKVLIEAAKPVVDAFDRIANADGSLCITDAAKALQVRPKDLFAFLRQREWVYSRPGKAGDIAYQDKLKAGYLDHKVTVVTRLDGTEKTTEQVRVTSKGLAKLALIVPGAQGINGNHPVGE